MGVGFTAPGGSSPDESSIGFNPNGDLQVLAPSKGVAGAFESSTGDWTESNDPNGNLTVSQTNNYSYEGSGSLKMDTTTPSGSTTVDARVKYTVDNIEDFNELSFAYKVINVDGNEAALKAYVDGNQFANVKYGSSTSWKTLTETNVLDGLSGTVDIEFEIYLVGSGFASPQSSDIVFDDIKLQKSKNIVNMPGNGV